MSLEQNINEIQKRLSDLDESLNEGDINKKFYCKQKWILLHEYLSEDTKQEHNQLLTHFENKVISEIEYYNDFFILLSNEYVNKSFLNISNGSSEKNILKRNSYLNKDKTLFCKEKEISDPKNMPLKNLESNGIAHKNNFTYNLRKFAYVSNKSENSKAEENSQNFNDDKLENKFNQELITTDIDKKDSVNEDLLVAGSSKERVTITDFNLDLDNQDFPDKSKKNHSTDSLDVSESKIRKIDMVNKSPKMKQRVLDSVFTSSKRKDNDVNNEFDVKKDVIDDVTVLETNIDKKIKLENDDNSTETNGLIEQELVTKKEHYVSLKRCDICHQRLNSPDLRIYQGHPHNAVEEFIALTDPKLALFTGDETEVHDDDQRPQNKITYFSVYDREGHLCPFDGGLIERDVKIYFSGYMKPVYEEDSSIEGGIPTKDMGPINEWWVSGFDGGELALLGFSTAYAEYYLMEPSEEYKPFMLAVREKIHLSKLVIEFLFEKGWQWPTYEDLLNHLETSVPASGMEIMNEECLLRHAQFICDQVASVDTIEIEEGIVLITLPCMRSLVKLAGVTFGKRKAMRRTERKIEPKVKRPAWSKATTTELVREVFETFFIDQLDTGSKSGGVKRRRCGICEACQRSDCGECTACLDMCKFGGSGKAKQACKLRRCPNMALEEADVSEPEDEDKYEELAEKLKKEKKKKHALTVNALKRPVEWKSEQAAKHAGRTYYSCASIADEQIEPGDYVLLESREIGQPLLIARVAYMWEEDMGCRKMFHAHYMVRGSETVLGETADPRELFVIDDCESIPLGSIVRKAIVTHLKHSDDWAMNGGLDRLPVMLEDDGRHFFFQKRYDPDLARFEDPFIDEPSLNNPDGYKPCLACKIITEQKLKERPQLQNLLGEGTWSAVIWHDYYLTEGVGIYLNPNTFKFNTVVEAPKFNEKNDFDPVMYPEFYRKTDTVRGSNVDTSDPFCIGIIKEIICTSNVEEKQMKAENVKLKIYKMYRPENTYKGPILREQLDFNVLYWSDELVEISLNEVKGECYITYSEIIDIPIEKWSSLGPDRFYFTQAYDEKKKQFYDVPMNAFKRKEKGKKLSKGPKSKSSVLSNPITEDKIKIKTYSEISRPLRTLDVFAGCGGLSEGLHQAGIAESKWAIEKELPTAHAYKLNNSDATVFSDDCNELLRCVIDGKTTTARGQELPQRGDVELLCGGPPCQGFSGMNRFNAGQYSLFKNSLIVSYLSFCDFYRPRFFILENVRNFVSFKRGMVLKLTLRCLIAMGYQCTFGVLQAGNYGVPQTRRRLIILAAAPGEKLPLYPEPTHVFSKHACKLSVIVDNKKFVTNVKWEQSAPYRTVTVRDSMSDLPTIRNGHKKEEISYDSDSISHFQRLMRGNQYQSILKDHICKEMAPLVEARMSFIPTAPGSDWRDLPNIVTRLSDGSYTRKLVYTHMDKFKKLRGVCACCEGKPCDPADRQDNTLIPWCLPHTGNRHNNWAGLYGRLEWNGFFSTTVTNPEPMGKQGRVLHPEQNRVVSVRECARSQGFPDSYRFFGNILDKHRQVGNAVPPPMAKQIGLEIKKCIAEKESQSKNVC